MINQQSTKEKKITMFVLAKNYKQYADWYTQFCPIPPYINRVVFLDETNKIRGFDRKTTEIFLLGEYWKNDKVDLSEVESLGYKVQGSLSNFIKVNGKLTDIRNL